MLSLREGRMRRRRELIRVLAKTIVADRKLQQYFKELPDESAGSFLTRLRQEVEKYPRTDALL